jgi:hypothetical protein
MNFKNGRGARWQMSLTALLVSFLLFGQIKAQTVAPAKLSVTENQLAEKISIDTIKEITSALSAPEMQGRGRCSPAATVPPITSPNAFKNSA